MNIPGPHRLSRRLLLGAGAAALLPSTLLAQQTFPNRPLTIIVPFTPGGAADIDVRLVAPELSRLLGQPVVVDNVSGAGGTIGVQKALRAPADGHTLFYGSTSETVIMPLINPQVKYRLEDMSALNLAGKTPLAFFTRPDFPAKDMEGLIAHARAHPGKLNFGTSGIGSFQHLVTEVIQERTGTQMTHVAYRGGAPVIAAVLGGEIDFGVTAVVAIQGLANQGKVQVLGVSSSQRSPVLQTAPAFSESPSLKDMQFNFCGMFFVPQGVPEPVLQRLSQALQEISQLPAVKEQRLKTGSVSGEAMTPAQAQAFVLKERDTYLPVTRRIKFD